ncbi:hypothetical protein MAR_003000 [Mya arenaria]|uniref:Uncharacterized protein n=1 Tax=Mya arenaria TaxID=6604 RepID=A0ABY7G666_MYAAR|nr:hypothetical protein MAR_003000 [Mya arenaria]
MAGSTRRLLGGGQMLSQYIRLLGQNGVRDIRNKTLHDANYELDGQKADDCLDKMITVLEDPQELIHDTFAKPAANQIRKIKAKTEETPAILTNLYDLRQRLAKYYLKQLNSAPISLLLSDNDEKLDKLYAPPKIVEKDSRKVGAVSKENGTHVTAYRQLLCKIGKFRKKRVHCRRGRDGKVILHGNMCNKMGQSDLINGYD